MFGRRSSIRRLLCQILWVSIMTTLMLVIVARTLPAPTVTYVAVATDVEAALPIPVPQFSLSSRTACTCEMGIQGYCIKNVTTYFCGASERAKTCAQGIYGKTTTTPELCSCLDATCDRQPNTIVTTKKMNRCITTALTYCHQPNLAHCETDIGSQIMCLYYCIQWKTSFCRPSLTHSWTQCQIKCRGTYTSPRFQGPYFARCMDTCTREQPQDKYLTSNPKIT